MGGIPTVFLAAVLAVSFVSAEQQTIADHVCSSSLGAEEQTGGLSENLDFLKPDTLLYGRPGADFGKGSTAAFAADFSQAKADSPLPKTFSWADYGKKPTVRDQGSLGTCWALTAAEAVESALLPQTHLVLSADHISLQNGFDIEQDEGGDYSMIMSYMADFKGPVTEEEDPYGDGRSPQGLKAAVHVGEMRLLEGMSADRIRHMIYRFGAVQTSLSMDRTRTDRSRSFYYNEETCSYYDPVTEPLNHDVLVLGWDDTYSKNNFRKQPAHDGAWICQNSWGAGFGRNGIFYVSYEDANVFRKGGIAYTDVRAAGDAARVLETDSLGWQARQGYGNDSAWFAGVFETESPQVLEAAGLYAVGPATAWRMVLVENFSGTDSLSEAASGKSGIPLGCGWIESPGFYTLRLSQPLSLPAGERFAVIVFVDTPGTGRPVAVETRKDRYTDTVSLDGRESYISEDGTSWERTQTAYRTNVCLKLYTSDAGQS
ncbi:lectin like domain-containing protein [Porcincola intestinalis]|uniref:lectin like domain-containing protein n=1 Tax=Porcincola intestinalis TaxID=2606632 RepID=UPI0012B27071|nr:lectin like domain-containing protein [Porcincola intestinalis]